jgi:type IV pilus assembly protein PilV
MSGVRYVPRVARRVQRGNFLLEAMIGVLIVAFGILGLIGLQARTIQNVTDVQFRSEAVFLANSLIGQMWITDNTQIKALFDSSAGGANYTEFKNFVAARLPGGIPPTVTVVQAVAPLVGNNVTVTVFWKPPGDDTTHDYVATAVVGEN